MFLEHIFISKVRIKILKLFFINLGEEYHVRGVVQEIDEEINAVRRELKNMEGSGLLSSRKVGNKVVYSLNKNYPLFQDLLSMVHKEFGIGGRFLRDRDELGDIQFAVVTRSFTKGIKIEPQNIDLLVVGDVDMQLLSNIVKETEQEMDREIFYTVMTDEEFKYRKKNRDSFLSNILEGSRVMLVGDEDDIIKPIEDE